MSNIFPFYVAKWINDDWVARCIAESGKTFADIVTEDINQPITRLGNTLLNIACLCLDRPSRSVTKDTVLWLLSCGASPNVADEYGRTALINMVTQSPSALRQDQSSAICLIRAMFEHKADPDVLFTPDYVSMAGCAKWTLAHHMDNVHHNNLNQRLPEPVVTLLHNHMSFNVADSEGRLPVRPSLQTALAL